jgi:hypothetical protein
MVVSMGDDRDENLVERIRASKSSEDVVETVLTTDERVLARVTDGIYRQPGSALRELVANAYDADATVVTIQTDRPRFKTLTVEDNGNGISPEVLDHLLHHIGGSAKRTSVGSALGVTDSDDVKLSPGGRRLIGRIGIGLFSVSQLTRSFQIITKVAGDDYRTVATVVLRQYSDMAPDDEGQYEAGRVNIWREAADDRLSHGTTIVLTDIRPQSRETLQSSDYWQRVDAPDGADTGTSQTPLFHIGRLAPDSQEDLRGDTTYTSLPWNVGTPPDEAFIALVNAVWEQVPKRNNPRLDELFDYYLRMVWQLSLSVPLKYVDGHPFDIKWGDAAYLFELPYNTSEAAKPFQLANGASVRSTLKLGNSVAPDPAFRVFFDDMELGRPLRFHHLPASNHAIHKPMLFVGKAGSDFQSVPLELSGGPLKFQAYLLWNPKIAPTEHQGALIRIHGASGTSFDRTYLRYQVSELTRLQQITCEIFITDGLEGALNIDRESFNFAHPHVVYLTRWLHSALRRLATAQKKVAADIRNSARGSSAKDARSKLDEIVAEAWEAQTGDPDLSPPSVSFAEPSAEDDEASDVGYRFNRSSVLGPTSRPRGKQQRARANLKEQKLKAIAKVLAAYGVLDLLESDDQERLLNALYRVLDAPDA